MEPNAIIIPCYNEEKRLRESSLEALIHGCDATLYLANDGSTDQTLAVLQRFAQKHPGRCHVLHYEKNSGKANTIYKAVNDLMAKGYGYIGYFDADFSTPPAEVIRLLGYTRDGLQQFIFGSRVLLLNSGIRRKGYRHVIGRIIITIINLKFHLKIYDTQCGAKIFSREIIPSAFDKPFKTSWLFDVEIFIRLKQKNLLQYGKEVPVSDWVDVDGSKLGWKSAFKIFRELVLLNRNYSIKS